MKLKIENLSYVIGDKNILNDISIDIKSGSFVGLVGPNGSGKSTLLKNIYRTLKPSTGAAYLNGKNIHHINTKKLAKDLAVVGQDSNIGFDFMVKDIVLLGRYPHKSIFQQNSQNDISILKSSLEAVGLSEYEDRNFITLSGGEKQRVLVARALAQKAPFLVMDEPTNHLDIKHQLQIMESVKNSNLTVFAAIHDMNIAATYCDKIVALKNGKIKKFGPPLEVFTNEFFKDIFDVDAHIMRHPITDKLIISYHFGF